MFRTIFCILIALFFGCTSYKKYAYQDILNITQYSTGRIKSKTYKQLISWPNRDAEALITEVYDSLGRIIKEYGFNHPAHRYSQYLTEIFYLDGKKHVVNSFIWEVVDSAGFFSDYRREFANQLILIDSGNLRKQVTIRKVSSNDKLIAAFTETFPVTSNSWTIESYEFEISWDKLYFDSSGKMVLTHIVKRK